MTRINLVPPEELSNQHLVAEVHELPASDSKSGRAVVINF